MGAADGIVDLVAELAREAEREYYEQQEYDEPAMSTGQGQIAALAQLWTDPSAIERQMLWANLGDLRDKTVLLLGNGDSEAELYFVTQRPELLIFSDLSLAAVSAVRSRYDLEGYEDVSASPRSTLSTCRSSTSPSISSTVPLLCITCQTFLASSRRWHGC